MTDEPAYAVHVRNGAVPAAVPAAAFADLGLNTVTIEDVPGEGQLSQVQTAVAALLAHLAQAHVATPAVALTRLAETLWAHLPDPDIALLLVDTTTDISARLSPTLPPAAYTALAAGRLGNVEPFGIVAYDPARGAWVQVAWRA
jgi:hypothetical protein